jgi:hypothetical protein
MAINPNTDFSSGAVYTADQANRFPRGVMAYNPSTVSDVSITTEEVQITGSSFTAVANRLYKITYFEPNMFGSTGYYTFNIRQTNISGTIIQQFYEQNGSGQDRFAHGIWIGTLTAGSQNFVATAQSSAGTGGLSRGSNRVAYLLVEDIGPS